ncbi:formate dehydrogenase accessory protein FdhE [Stutzerimonas zhaodongensis]|uniref:Formate dehydrogenase accessory protein FdhE n=1 Tax=Stutzerimonas zhaodongensis TaxID=1176257 RepID=A0A3M2HP52_9GAMM|nr:formate dehydrogenase accessory protein FdhE [Stutzerimonas zhaodongensis]MCQ4316038.1 formate dehydrogenase accessory protein FdhE [Stutzerimonas zhaodongensis]RMH89370.1 formate dehydrogenase accessory protein FdhE [Stutzerimonas zhaodongensis]
MEAPNVVLPDAKVFSKRATRLRELVQQVPPLDEFLAFMARVVQAQHQVLNEREPAWKPASDAFDQALKHGMPPLGFQALRRDVQWSEDLRAMLDAIELHVGERQRPLLKALRQMDQDGLDALAEDVLEANPGTETTRPLLPLVAAALQISWLRLAMSLPRPPEKPTGEARALCPCCGAPPVASVIHNERHRAGVRYLHCSLCATEWHLERIKCSVCDSPGKLIYLSLDDEQGKPFLPVQAEACGECHSYLKIMQREVHGRADPVADDLATLALDLLLAEEGEYGRSGYNPLLIAGD